VTHAVLATPVFDFSGGMYGLLFAGRHLDAGMSGTLPTVSDTSDAYELVPYHVVSRSRVRAGWMGDVDAWVVEAGDPVAFRIWVMDRAPYIARLVAPGPNADSVWEMTPALSSSRRQ